jgi:hypothetical protein
MDKRELTKILKEHLKWVSGNGGKSADLSGAALSGADLRRANLRRADLRRANLRRADLRHAALSRANLSDANLFGADLRHADLSGAALSGADLRYADLSDANLSDADLRHAALSGAALSRAKNWTLSKSYLNQFKTDKNGIIVYKAIGNTTFNIPSYWEIKENSFLEEIVNPDRGTQCGCGVNFGTLEWIQQNYPTSEIWECLILWEDVADIVVPFNTDGKARCARLQLLKKI